MTGRTARLLGVLAVLTFATVVFVVPGCANGSSANGDNAEGGDDGDDGDDVTVIGADGAPQKGCAGYPGQDPSKLPGRRLLRRRARRTACPRAPSRRRSTARSSPARRGPGLCVPDTIIQKGSEYVPTTCTTKLLSGRSQGVCLSECITLVAGNPQTGLLKSETCGAGELCVPCIDPLTMQPTGACNIDNVICGDGGSLDAGERRQRPAVPVHGPAAPRSDHVPGVQPGVRRRALRALGARAHGGPVAARDAARAAACPASARRTPSSSRRGPGVPKTCTSVAGSEGRCLSTCLPAVAAEAAGPAAGRVRRRRALRPLLRPGRAPTRRCPRAPARSRATSPRSRRPSSACPYTGPPIIDPSGFPDCSPACAGSHCVPSSLVPAADQSAARDLPRRLLRARLHHLDRRARACRRRASRSRAPRGAACPRACPRSRAEASAPAAEHLRHGREVRAVLQPRRDQPEGADRRVHPRLRPARAAADHPDVPLDGAARHRPDDAARLRQRRLLRRALPAGGRGARRRCSRSSRRATAGRASARRTPSSPRATTRSRTSCDPFPGSGAPGRCLSAACPQVQSEVGRRARSCSRRAPRALLRARATTRSPAPRRARAPWAATRRRPRRSPSPSAATTAAARCTGTCVPSAQVPVVGAERA